MSAPLAVPRGARRFAVLVEGSLGVLDAKTAVALLRYAPESVAALIDREHAGSTANEVLGFGGGIPIVDGLASALAHRPDAVLVGDANGFRHANLAALSMLGARSLEDVNRRLHETSEGAEIRRAATGQPMARADLPFFRALRGQTVSEELALRNVRTGDAVVGDLPDRVTSFMGRDREVDAIRGLLVDGARLVTLTGPGGIGKSSLAVEAARVVQPAFPDGAWFVPLAEVTDPDEVPAAIARGIGLRDGPERSAATALLPYIADRRLLVVLDNLEQVLDAAGQVAALVRASPASRVLVTSRAPLHIDAEHEVPVTPLTEEATALFDERARAVRPDWDGTADRATVEEICRLLDDLPLGIELAAARVSMLSPAAIRDRLAARLPLPGPGRRDAPARQRTLDSAVAWSHDLLEPDQLSLLHDLAIFEGGFEPEQVAAVAGGPGDRLDDLVDLADRNLIVVEPTSDGRR